MRWRWDQGRLGYFQFENLRAIAHCLKKLDGVIINQKDIDPLRDILETYTGLPFAPTNYRVWRNYKRVFECSFLATNVNDRLYITDFCRELAKEVDKSVDADEFLSLFIPRFRFPFPAFTDYEKSEIAIYPFCAILKFLIAGFRYDKRKSASLEDIFSFIIGNKCTGTESLAFYSELKATNYFPQGDESRQVREMLIFISQLSILKWYHGSLYIDVSSKDYEDYNEFFNLITPIYKEPKSIREEEYLSMTSLSLAVIHPFKLQSRELPTDNIFIEGKRNRVTHMKIERSPLLRKIFFEKYPNTTCDMCVCDMKIRYPWTENILEVHHILPLASSLVVTGEGTSFNDIVGLCPNCHKSVHSYYKNWLNKYNFEDFRSRDEAKEIYNEAKTKMLC